MDKSLGSGKNREEVTDIASFGEGKVNEGGGEVPGRRTELRQWRASARHVVACKRTTERTRMITRGRSMRGGEFCALALARCYPLEVGKYGAEG